MKVLGQTLFLGASVVSFSSNVGWGGNSSSLTVELIEDVQPFGKTPFRKFDQNKTADYGHLDLNSTSPLPNKHPGPRDLGVDFYTIPHYNINSYPDNHYYNCINDDCYTDELGRPYASSPTKKEKNVPGKIYYYWNGNRFVSQYWYLEDPGFLGTGSFIQPNGSINTNGPLNTYDIIDTPVYFKFDNFEFIGLVKNWERNNRPGGITYSVTIQSLDTILNACKVILKDYNGGLPIPTLLNTTIPNLFNVYGFLESMGINRFGGSGLNDNGISARLVIDALRVLTSSSRVFTRNDDFSYSPFGRILTKSIKRVAINYNTVDEPYITNMGSFGVICSNSPVRSLASIYNSFALDLSSLPVPPYDYRVSGNPDISISQLINQIISDTGLDYMTVAVPVPSNNGVELVIKVITVSRTQYNPIYQIPTVVSQLENAGYNIENSSFGQEANQNNVRKIIFGGNQQRFYQAKTYRLAYTQDNYIYNPILKQFINNKRPTSKVRNPSLDSTIINNIRIDRAWGDSEVNRKENILQGNYFNTKILNNGTRNIKIREKDSAKIKERKEKANAANRFIPLYKDVICPYFGTKLDVLYAATSDSNMFRFVRPVYLDTWTNEITIAFGINEIPPLSIGEPLTLYNNKIETKNENEGVGEKADDNDEEEDDEEENDEGGGDGDNNVNNLPPQPPEGLPPNAASVSSLEFEPLTYNSQNLIVVNTIPTRPGMDQLPPPPPQPDTPQDQPVSDGGIQTPGASNPGSENLDDDTETPKQRTNSRNRPVKSDKNVLRTKEFKPAGFTIKETELRCSNFDSYLIYCLGKSYFSKPDLFVMLVEAYKRRGILLDAKPSTTEEKINPLDAGGGMGAINVGVANPTTVAEDGHVAEPRDALKAKFGMNWDFYLNHNFIKDLKILHNFIQNIAQTYYGKKFMVKLPDVYAYKDSSYLDISIPGTTSSFFVYQGSQKIMYNYEIASDGAWEEPGNYIDDSFVFGDNYWNALKKEDGLLGTILGYNYNLNIDDVYGFWCSQSSSQREQIIRKQAKIETRRNVFMSKNPQIAQIQTLILNLESKINNIDKQIAELETPTRNVLPGP